MLRAYLSGLSDGECYTDTAELLLSELFANAVQHTHTPDDHHIEIRFTLTPDHLLRIEVHDAGTEHPTLRIAGPDDEHGRGLFLVNELAHRWGCEARLGGIGKFIWVLVAPAVTPSLLTA
ncbi:hypothetical protein BU198_02575 [Streptomyces sp. CBMA156]|nr:hypothetical protein [Streptomyces sp. CBMA156]